MSLEISLIKFWTEVENDVPSNIYFVIVSSTDGKCRKDIRESAEKIQHWERFEKGLEQALLQPEGKEVKLYHLFVFTSSFICHCLLTGEWDHPRFNDTTCSNRPPKKHLVIQY